MKKIIFFFLAHVLCFNAITGQKFRWIPPDIHTATPGVSVGQVLKWDGTAFTPGNDSLGATYINSRWADPGTGYMYPLLSTNAVLINRTTPFNPGVYKLQVAGGILAVGAGTTTGITWRARNSDSTVIWTQLDNGNITLTKSGVSIVKIFPATSGIDGNIALGRNATATGVASSAFGPYCDASATNGLAIGVEAVASATDGMAFGRYIFASATGAVALGRYLNSSGANGILIGAGQSALGHELLVPFATGAVGLGAGSRVPQFNIRPMAITGSTWTASGNVVTSSAAHGLVVGDPIILRGAAASSYHTVTNNGGTNTFTVSGAAPASSGLNWRAYATNNIFEFTNGTDGTVLSVLDKYGKWGLGTTTPSVALDIVATTAIRIPSGTTAQAPTGAVGMMRHDATTGTYQGVPTGTTWVDFLNALTGWSTTGNTVGAATKWLGTSDNFGFAIRTNNIVRGRIDTLGRWAINQNNPLEKIDVGGNARAQHFYGAGNPTIAAGAGAGTSPSISISGTDVGGKITLVTGTSPTADAIFATITFANPFSSEEPAVVLQPAGVQATAVAHFVDSSSTTFAIYVVGALTASTQYEFFYNTLQ